MKKLYFIFLLILPWRICFAQNLVLNGNFEQYSGCPSGGEFDSLLFWKNPCTIHAAPSGGSPDFFSSCTSNSTWSVPYNFGGYQLAHSGNGYAGLAEYHQNVPDFREYMEGTLLETLKKNGCYFFQMHVCLAEQSEFTTNSIGIFFSDTIVSGITSSLPLPLTPQVNVGFNYITDTANWTLISGNYASAGGEKYILIGNFNADTATTLMTVVSTATYPVVYFYIDDVSLEEIECKVGVNENNLSTLITVYPNPINDRLNISSQINDPLEICVYDLNLRIVLSQHFTNAISLNTEQLESGIYIYEIKNKNVVVKKGKVVKE